MSEDIPAYRLVKSVNLSNERVQLIKATLPELQYDSMKDQLKKTFSDSSRHISIKGGGLIETENALLAAGFDNLHLADSYQDNAPKLLSTMHLENNNLTTFTEETMMTSNHMVANTTLYITETIITQLLTNLTHAEQTNNSYRDFSPTVSMLFNKTGKQFVPKQFPVRGRKIHVIVMVYNLDA